MINHSVFSLVVFLAAFLIFAVKKNWKTHTSLAASLILVIFGIVSIREVFFHINWNVMGLYTGVAIVAYMFARSGVPEHMVFAIVRCVRRADLAMLVICAMTGLISVVLENVACVMIMAPLVFAFCEKTKCPVVPLMIGVAISSNLQGAATLIGDPPSMLLAGFANMNFFDFFFYQGRPGIFFAVQISALASMGVLYLFFRKFRQPVVMPEPDIAQDKGALWITVLLILSLSALSFLPLAHMPPAFRDNSAGILCMFWGAFAFVRELVAVKENRQSILRRHIAEFDRETFLFLLGIFIIVGNLQQQGWIEMLADTCVRLTGGSAGKGFILLVAGSVLVSAFVDNVPFLAATLPLARTMSAQLGVEPALFYFGLLIGASVGGNITPIGASANIVAWGLLKKKNIHMGFYEFVRMGLPFTVAAIAAGSFALWRIWR